MLKKYAKNIEALASGMTYPEISKSLLSGFKIPLPPLDIQQKIVDEIEVLDKLEASIKLSIEKLKQNLVSLFDNQGSTRRIDEVCLLQAGKFLKADEILHQFTKELYPCYGGNGFRGYTKTFTNEGQYSLVGRQGALCGNVHLVSGKFHATEHALVVYPKDNVLTVWLHQKLIQMDLNQYATGTAQPGLSVKNINSIEIHVPTLEEQQKIVTEIEKIEAEIAELERKIADIPQQKDAVLKEYL